VTLLLPTAGEMSGSWVETMFIPYGDTEDTLGTSPGGDGGSVDWGPEYGTQTPDGTWWFLDAAKLRIAHFGADGGYLGAVEMTPDLLVDGRYFQFQMPQALDDGTVVAAGFRPESTQLLVVDGDTARVQTIDRELGIVSTDGVSLLGDDVAGGGRVRVDPDSGAVEDGEWLVTRAGTRYGFDFRGDESVIELPDASSPVSRTVTLRWGDDPESPAFAGAEVETGADGTLHVYLYGAPEADESVQLAGYFSVAPNGAIIPIEASRTPFSDSDPGSPAHLGVDPSTGTPWLMFVDTDGVRVFSRVG
jgi:hypothetical protein